MIDKELIGLLQEQNLNEEVLLFYYSNANYSKCIQIIIEQYEEIENIKNNFNNINSSKNSNNKNNNLLPENMQKYELDKKDKLDNINSLSNLNIKVEETNESKEIKEDNKDDIKEENKEDYFKINFSHSITQYTNNKKNEPEKNLKYFWFERYINFISSISEQISSLEFLEYMKWALLKDPIATIDLLINNDKISSKAIDFEFINLLKNYGIDAVIHYFKKLLKSSNSMNPEHYNEMSNLYILKLKLLFEEQEKEMSMSNRRSLLEIIDCKCF